MPHHLSKAQLESLRAALDARAKTLRRELGDALHDPQAREALGLPNRHAETDDDAVAELEATIDIASAQRDARELNDVIEALARMHDEEYGICVQCGRDIPLARLQAQPSAKRCVTCESELERKSGRNVAEL